jgi:23S rRNA 5-hydroxycytidine C2501 synthase
MEAVTKKTSSGKVNLFFMPNPSKTFNRGYTNYFANSQNEKIASLNTQKSLGQYLGKVSDFSKHWFTIGSNETVSNNDGLCFFNNEGVLVGIKVNKVVSNKIFPNEPVEVYEEADIYRNYDHNFNQLLQKESTAQRLIGCSIDFDINSDDIKITLTDEDSLQTSLLLKNNFEDAKKPDEVSTLVVKQLEKTGGTPYAVIQVKLANRSTSTPFIPLSTINSWRRDIVEKHTLHRQMCYKHRRCELITNNTPYPQKTVDYRANIANKLAKQFYERHGVLVSDMAFEHEIEFSRKMLMETRYCILLELGVCDGKKGTNSKSKKFYLQNSNAKYPLRFDCKTCIMHVILP